MSLRVVLADDHVVLRQGVRALLERHGFEVVAEASDGRTAVELTRQHEPNVAVLDIMMPLLNGIDAARQIVEACPGTQVVMLTALEQERLVTDAVQAGVRGFVLKTQAGGGPAPPPEREGTRRGPRATGRDAVGARVEAK